MPVGTLTALAFAGPIAAYMSTQRDTSSFNSIWRFGITPLFLFSGTFFPITAAARADPLVIAWVLPLWHGVDLGACPGARHGLGGPAAAARPPRDPDAMAVGGAIAMFVMFRRRLEQ